MKDNILYTLLFFQTQIRTMDPPQCVQNAMMTKDKKPFTYTPGGIDLSEVRSPRMQRRIERNANLAGAGDIPKPQPPPPQNINALPPSVQVAMRPQPQVQVFPSGPPPPAPTSRGGAPPPPPPFSAPPPPPPPSGPLPTQKVMTGDNQVLERPDMTKIIPDNPMALLRKTGGPAPRKSIVDEMFAQEGKMAPGPITPPSGQRPQPQFEQQQQRYISFLIISEFLKGHNIFSIFCNQISTTGNRTRSSNLTCTTTVSTVATSTAAVPTT